MCTALNTFEHHGGVTVELDMRPTCCNHNCPVERVKRMAWTCNQISLGVFLAGALLAMGGSLFAITEISYYAINRATSSENDKMQLKKILQFSIDWGCNLMIGGTVGKFFTLPVQFFGDVFDANRST